MENLQEQSRLKLTDELRKFTEVDNWEAVKIWRSGEERGSARVVMPSFNKASSPNPRVREKMDELTRLLGEAVLLRTFINTTHVGESRWMPRTKTGARSDRPSMWDNLYYICVDTQDQSPLPSGKGRGDEHYDPASELKIV